MNSHHVELARSDSENSYDPNAMIINEMAGSGADWLPWYFRKMKIRPLIGKRTWGAFPASRLRDGGFVAAPDAAIYGLIGEWEVENNGVGPDLEVEFDPAAWRLGRDPHLEKAVEVFVGEIKEESAGAEQSSCLSELSQRTRAERTNK